MAKINVQTTGFHELAHVFRELPKRVQTKVLRDGSNAGATPVNQALRSAARSIRVTGMLAKSIGRRRKQYSGKGGKKYMNIIGSRVHGFRVPVSSLKFRKKKYRRFRRNTLPQGMGAKKRKKLVGEKFKNPVKYFPLVEFGTKFARAVPIFEVSFAASSRTGMKRMEDRIRLGVMQEARALARM